jgi:hypothetical protein
MKVIRGDRKGMIDIRHVRRLLLRYVEYWRKQGRAMGWPDHPVGGAVYAPGRMARRFRSMLYDTRRQRNWAKKIARR